GSSKGVPLPLRFSNGGRPRPIVSVAPHGGVTPESTREPNAGIITVDTESSASWNPPPDGISALPALAGCTASAGKPPADLTGTHRSAQPAASESNSPRPLESCSGSRGLSYWSSRFRSCAPEASLRAPQATLSRHDSDCQFKLRAFTLAAAHPERCSA